jgi:hypothetical protein
MARAIGYRSILVSYRQRGRVRQQPFRQRRREPRKIRRLGGSQGRRKAEKTGTSCLRGKMAVHFFLFWPEIRPPQRRTESCPTKRERPSGAGATIPKGGLEARLAPMLFPAGCARRDPGILCGLLETISVSAATSSRPEHSQRTIARLTRTIPDPDFSRMGSYREDHSKVVRNPASLRGRLLRRSKADGHEVFWNAVFSRSLLQKRLRRSSRVSGKHSKSSVYRAQPRRNSCWRRPVRSRLLDSRQSVARSPYVETWN